MNAVRQQQPSRNDILEDVCAGLAQEPKRLSSRYFYDAEGSRLFERICQQPEYYLTRCELAIMREYVGAMTVALGPQALVVEYGSGSGIKTRLLLEHLVDPVAYVPVEISQAALRACVADLHARYPNLEMLPVCADFTQPVDLPRPQRQQRRNVIYFPGSTIGNFDNAQARELLCNMRAEVGAGGAVLIGVDLVKDTAILEAAYNDAAGVTAQFTLNMLAHLNRVLGADFDLARFAHRSRYHPQAARIETAIVSRATQDVHIGSRSFAFAAGEPIEVELSCKYSRESFAALAADADLRVGEVWTDPDGWFSVQYLHA